MAATAAYLWPLNIVVLWWEQKNLTLGICDWKLQADLIFKLSIPPKFKMYL